MPESGESLEQMVSRALAEDLGSGDVSTEVSVPEGAGARARMIQKQAGVVFGLDLVGEVMRQSGVERVENVVAEGRWCDRLPAEVIVASGSAPALLDRGAQRAQLPRPSLRRRRPSPPATSRRSRAAGSGSSTPARLRRGFAGLEKAAVAAGGGRDHRMGLYDAILIKENHIALAGGLARAIHRARTLRPDLAVEVECPQSR